MYDVGKGRPVNPDALVGEAVGKRFVDGNSGAIFSGAIVSYDPKKRWWKVAYDDGDVADYNFRELTKFDKPPDFSALRYEQTTACDQYLSEVPADTQAPDASPVLVENAFRLEGAMYKMVNVFCDHKTFEFWCAYCPLEDHCGDMEEASRSVLRSSFPDVEVALYNDVKMWVKAYEAGKAAPQTSRNQRQRPALKTGGVNDSDSGSDTDDGVPLAMLLKAFR